MLVMVLVVVSMGTILAFLIAVRVDSSTSDWACHDVDGNGCGWRVGFFFWLTGKE
jgi:hypothetical protein